MEDLLKNYLTQKYGENYDEEAKKNLESAQSQNKWANFASNLGDVIAGNKVGSANQYFQGLNDEAKANTVGKYEKEGADYLKNQTANSQLKDIMTREELDKAQADPASRQSILANALAKKYNLPVQPGDSYKDISQFMDPRKMMETDAASNVDFNKQKALRLMDQSFKSKENELSRQNDIEKMQAKIQMDAQKKKDPMNLSTTDKQRYDNVLMAIRGLDAMAKALDDKQNTFSLIGDNDYTAGERDATEAYGRMQSGGAINKEEHKNFLSTLPSVKDSKDIQRKKLIKQRNEMISRLNTLGFTPEDAKIEPLDLKYGKPIWEGEDKEVSNYAKDHNISYDNAMNVKMTREQKAMR